jgi:2,5-diamino-6-(ribosylamino)-4(3H)-pyrimidinone 5'-phosphate reductase
VTRDDNVDAMTARPRVLVNFAVSLDGKTNPAPGKRHGAFAMSRGKDDWRLMRELRARADAILIGATNQRVDDPGLSLSPDERERRRAAGQPLPVRIVVTRRGEGIRPEAKIFDRSIGGPTYVVHAANMPGEVRALLAPVATLIEMDATSVPMAGLLTWMRKTLGAQVVMCEGGGDLVAQLFAARAVDELYVTVVPRILGGTQAPTLAGGAGFEPDQIPDAALTSLERIGDELYLRYDFSWA